VEREGVVSHDPDAVAAQEHQVWQRAADDYAEILAPFTAHSGQIPLLEELGRIDKRSAILELGCGAGDVAVQLARLGSRMVGVDFSENMVEIASTRFPGLEFEVADAEALPFGDGEFDVVASCYTAHHFARPDRVFGEARRVLKAGGRVAVVMPIQSEQKSFGAFFESAREEIAPEDVPGGPLLDVSAPDAVAQLLSGAGYSEVFVEKRVKPTRLDSVERVLRAGWSFMALDDHPEEVQERIRSKTIERAAQFKLSDGSFEFPDTVIVASAVK
jgi:SAM-dependent methyltransferase